MNVKYTFFLSLVEAAERRKSSAIYKHIHKDDEKNLIAFLFAHPPLPSTILRRHCWWQAHSTSTEDYKIPFDVHLISKPFLMEKYRGYAVGGMCEWIPLIAIVD